MSPETRCRVHGESPYGVALVHGGPGAAGELGPLARELSGRRGVLEPLQTATSVAGQVTELAAVLGERGTAPLVLIGFSWGAWLSVLCAADFPHLVAKLILVDSGPFEEPYAEGIADTRLGRLDEREKAEMASLFAILQDPQAPADDLNRAFRRFGDLFGRADAYDPLPEEGAEVIYRADIFRSVWPEAAAMRRAGDLLAAAARIRCPVAALHGDHDPHPAAGVRDPLSRVVPGFRFHLLEHCGHRPWLERRARERFFELLERELPG